MDVKEDPHIPILFSRPFLATPGAFIDVKKGKLTFVVRDEKIILSQFLNNLSINDLC